MYFNVSFNILAGVQLNVHLNKSMSASGDLGDKPKYLVRK